MIIATVALYLFVLLLASLWMWTVINTNQHLLGQDLPAHGDLFDFECIVSRIKGNLTLSVSYENQP